MTDLRSGRAQVSLAGPVPDLLVHSLASGSSGNCMVVRAGKRAVLIDAGISTRRLVPLLERSGIRPGQLECALLTHEHDDHARCAQAISRRFGCPVVGNRATLEAVSKRQALDRTREMATGAEDAFGPFRIRSFSVSHDAADPVGYVLEAAGRRIACATDVGCITPELRAGFRGADLCILEANHDEEWLRRGPYPAFMKARIAGSRGHLCNLDAAMLLAERLETDGPACIWLAHLSRVNNSPALAHRSVSESLSAATRVPFHLEIALRDRPSASWQPGQTAVQQRIW